MKKKQYRATANYIVLVLLTLFILCFFSLAEAFATSVIFYIWMQFEKEAIKELKENENTQP